MGRVVELFYANGDRYSGQVKDGMKHGEGIYVFANGNKFFGA